jgi:hypothetical protein
MIHVLHKYKYPTSQAMLEGQYFETLAIGQGAYGSCHSLPRNTRTGQPKVKEDRILKAVQLFKQVAVETGIIVDKSNTQVEKKIPVIDSNFPDIQIYIKVVADIISPFVYKNINCDIAILDLKLTADRNNTFFNPYRPWESFCWGDSDKMSKLQASVYSSIFEIPFINIIFDTKIKNPGWIPIPIKTVVSHPNDSEAKLRHLEMKQGITKCISQLVEWNNLEWPTNPGVHCGACNIETCKEKKIINHV